MNAGHRSLLSLFDIRRCTRRTFLLSAMLSLTAGGLSSRRYALADTGPEPCIAPPWLWRTIGDQQSAARLGRAYLDTHPEYGHCHALLTDIERALKRQHASISLTTDADQAASALRGLLRKEFAHGEVISVAGWVLSKTEARLYALVYLVTTMEDPFSEPATG